MNVNKRLENIADTLLFGGFGALIVEIIAIVLKNKLVHDMGAVNYRIFFLCIGLITCGFFVVSMWYRHIAWSDKKHKPKVIGWTLYDKNQKSWEDAHKNEDPSAWSDVEQAIVDEIRRKKYKFGGNYHQYGASGCPVMDDGTTVMVSMRHWGDLMSRVWGGDYCDYAWTHDQGEGYKVPPVKEGNWNKIQWMTEEEIKERERQFEEAKKQNEAEVAEIRKNREKAQQKEHKANLTYAAKFSKDFLKKRGLTVNADVATHMAELLVKVYEDCRLPECAGLKWILSPAERAKVAKENAEKRKKAAEDFKKFMEEKSVELQP